MHYSFFLIIALSNDLLFGMQAQLESRFKGLPSDLQTTIKHYLIQSNSPLFKTRVPPRPYTLDGHTGRVT